MATKLQTKEALRKDLRKKRTQLAGQLDVAARDALARNFFEFLPNLQGMIVAGYMRQGSEVNCSSLLRLLEMRGIKVALPVVAKKNTALEFRSYAFGDDLRDGPLGNREPLKSADQVEPDIILVPLLGFDDKGNRIGQGQGYYDRTLKALRKKREILAVGLAYQGQEQKTLPVEAGDQALDAVLTEAGCWIF
ncbi:MAG: 5-formyltetrahydrofolate cyclo-ligase, partial [Proteobacteria bacterium]|nr:5-formyltetrahydrofolate cyclo-ligase [Pseudomonadota bacterium]